MKLKTLFPLAVLLLFSPFAQASSSGNPGVQQFGAVTATHCAIWKSAGLIQDGGTCGGGGPTSVSNSDGTLTISPTTGAVIASIALGHANSWSGSQNFTAGLLGSGANFYGSNPQIIAGAGSATVGSIALHNASNNNSVIIQGGVPASGDLTFTLPSADGANGNCLQTNGSGMLSFASCGTGFPVTVAHNDLLAQTAAVSNVLNYTTPNDSTVHTYFLSFYSNVTANTLDTLGYSVTFQDENNTTQTFTGPTILAAAGATGYLPAIGSAPGKPSSIRAYPNTAITLSTTQTVTSGSITYDIGGSIMRAY